MDTSNINQEVINKIFPKGLETPEFWETKYLKRNLTDKAIVTRIAPSPTGFMHIGGIYAALISERLAHQDNGIFYLRIEDTDKKREVPGATELIIDSLANYDIKIDEGPTKDNKEFGNYGPYKQSEREMIYKSYIKKLLLANLAYPCFSSNEELEAMRELQEKQKIKTGYYGNWAIWRNKSEAEVLTALKEDKPFVIRFRSPGINDNKIKVEDLLLGKRELPENDQDIVIMKSDGLPTYHLAHVVDDYLMGTTHVIRGNEWFPSLALHYQLFKAFNWPLPKYGHIFPIQKLENSSKRKLSKRKDPEANILYYSSLGYPKQAVIEYLLNLANSNFEDWRKLNPGNDNRDFKLSLEKLAKSNGPLLDIEKLNNISKEIIAKYSAEKVFNETLSWAKIFKPELATTLEKYPEYSKDIFNIERENVAKVRKDIAKWSDIETEIEYFFDENFNLDKSEIEKIIPEITYLDIKNISAAFLESFSESDTNEIWFEKIKKIATNHGFAENNKLYKENPEKYKGSVAEVAKVIRVLLTGRTQTPDLYSIIKTMGRDRVIKRLSL